MTDPGAIARRHARGTPRRPVPRIGDVPALAVLSTSPRALLLHPGAWRLTVQGDAASAYARAWLYSGDPSIVVYQHLSHAVAPASPGDAPVERSYWTFALASDHTWVADSAGGYAPVPGPVDAPPDWSDDGLTTWDKIVAQVSPGLSDAADAAGKVAASLVPSTTTKILVGLGLATVLVLAVRGHT